MKKTLRTEDILKSYGLLKGVNYQKLEDSDKVKVWKAVRQLKPIAMQFEEAKQDAVQSLVPQNFTENLQKAQAYEKQKQTGSADLVMTEEEYKAFLREFQICNQLVADALKEQEGQEHEIDYEPLTEDALGLLIVSNGWPLDKGDTLDWLTE